MTDLAAFARCLAHELDSQCVSNMIWDMAKLRLAEKLLLVKLSKQWLRTLRGLRQAEHAVESLTCTAWAMRKQAIVGVMSMSAAAAAATARITELRPSDASNMVQKSSEATSRFEAMLETVSCQALKAVDKLSWQDISIAA